MLNDHYLEKENFHSLIAQDGAGNVEERLNIIDAFLEMEKHITIEELTNYLKEKGYDYDN